MTPQDLRLFCTALGFTVVVVKGNEHAHDHTSRALGFASLIESFCRHVIPFDSPANQDTPADTDTLIERIKADLRLNGEADMNHDRACLLRLYDRLRQRYAAYASDDMLADRVVELLDAEIERDASA